MFFAAELLVNAFAHWFYPFVTNGSCHLLLNHMHLPTHARARARIDVTFPAASPSTFASGSEKIEHERVHAISVFAVREPAPGRRAAFSETVIQRIANYIVDCKLQ